MCELNQTPFFASVVFGEDRDGDFLIIDSFNKFRADLFANAKIIIIPKSVNASTSKRVIEVIGEAITSVLTTEIQECFVISK
ncbi:hypothetical protein LguiA_030012 [Lonicera macranthoides]